jgi:sodium-dependent dicarboxylate transporter 2/3/5
VAGPLAALGLFWLLPGSYFDPGKEAVVPLTEAARATMAAMAWMAVWWLTEAVDIAATSLLPIVLFPLAGIASIEQATAPYANSVIYLFLGSFVVALSMQRWGLDRRLALHILRLVGTRPANMIGGFMIATAALSAFVSNTATAAMMLPIAVSVVAVAHQRAGAEETTRQRNFSPALMLSIAYAASIGGLATIVGTPPNLFLVGFLHKSRGLEVSFASWLKIGLPVVAVLLPATWWLLTRLLYPVERRPVPGASEALRKALSELGPMARGERATLAVFLATAAAWISRPLISEWTLFGARPLARLSDTGIAVAAALALFLIPVDRKSGTRAMDWKAAEKLPWGVLVLFGGGLSLATAIQNQGVAEFLGAQAHALASWPELAIVLLVTTTTIFLTELTSNTATAAALVPILSALAPGLGVPEMHLVVPATLAASCAFMLPVATPPNAIVFGSGQVSQGQMARAGFWLNLLAILPITALAWVGIASTALAGK